jgi:cation diffusion facilitator CzcD-associated flavoprotein CzcO
MKYVFAPEIFGHAQRIARTFGLYERALFSTGVTGLAWDEASSRWIIQTDRGDEIRARFVAMGTGPLHRPKLPGIPGIDTFAGHAFHTSRWDLCLHRRRPERRAHDGARRTSASASSGPGATAVQCIPPLGRDAKELFVFQRTRRRSTSANNHPIDPSGSPP